MKAKTYEDWNLIGYQVRKGEKATGRCPLTGKATFTRNQVDEQDRDQPEDQVLDWRDYTADL